MSSTFCPTSAFSDLDFNIEAHVDDHGLFRVGLKVKDLFKVEAVDPAFISALKFIMNGKNHLRPPATSTKHSEKGPGAKEMMVSLCSNIFLPLSEKDVLIISETKLLVTNGHLSRSGLALLWLVINHR